MPALDAFHTKQGVFESLHTAWWPRFAENFTASMRGEVKGQMGIHPGFAATGDTFTSGLRQSLSLAENFYVAPTMNALVTAAADAWEADETVEEEDFPTDAGWLWIPGGISTIDVRGLPQVTSALSWRRRADVVEVVLWQDKANDRPDVRTLAGWDEMPRLTPWHVSPILLGQRLPMALQMGTVIPPEVASQIRWIENDNDLAMAFPMGWDASQMELEVRPDRILAWLVSALRIMQQPLATVETKGLPAQVRKAMMRHPKRVKNTRVTVVDFRRRVADFEPGSGREYSHRFLRRGHWRRQPYKRDDGSWDRRRIWIHPTIVGDPDKPLILRDHVNALTR